MVTDKLRGVHSLDINALFWRAGELRSRYESGCGLKDLAALPTNVALTLWDALPVYLSAAIALALIARVWLPPAWFAGYWSLRWLLDPTGLVYLALFERQLVPAYLLISVTAVGLRFACRRYAGNPYVANLSRLPVFATRLAESPPTTPISAARWRAGEVFAGVLVAAIIAGVINMLSDDMPEPIARLGLPLLANTLFGPAFGPSAIPAVAASSTSGTSTDGVFWLALAAFLTALHALVRQAPPGSDQVSDSSALGHQIVDN